MTRVTRGVSQYFNVRFVQAQSIVIVDTRRTRLTISNAMALRSIRALKTCIRAPVAFVAPTMRTACLIHTSSVLRSTDSHSDFQPIRKTDVKTVEESKEFIAKVRTYLRASSRVL